ncbi:Phosphoglycerate mutase [Desulfamplus magnetovallimortis]|uniref:Phosphoglycerate mutase n=1 Tax=Desulfamplus magnetovallimortis TaxID=1246637 RepID=A0A1W1H6E6_9BACT|nr:histidine phosphatase family protein [Desulfamplus magnetovallimortis]SLM28039.1 Phosphoglycerate mutase [Desulfamplus magnetovallimortis]
MTEFVLMRHAETIWNRQKKIQGTKDSPLTPFGEEMAIGWGKELKKKENQAGRFSSILSSDLGRAVKTARLVNSCLDIPLMMDIGLREMDWGEWTGKVYKEIRKASPEAVKKQVHLCWQFRPPGGESRIDLLQRSLDALESASEKFSFAEKERILVVTHEGVIRTLINYFFNRSFMWNEPDIMEPWNLHSFFYDHEETAFKLKQVNMLKLSLPPAGDQYCAKKGVK